MILEYQDVDGDRLEVVDVVVVGTGCGGAVIARELAHAGRSVLMLERGGYYDVSRGDFDQREDDMMARIDGGRGFHSSSNGQITLTYGNNVGGASVHYWADTWRTPRDRLEMWERDYGVLHHSYEELLPYFEQIERDLNVQPAMDHMLNEMNRLFDRGADQLGMRTERVHQARRGCIGSGYCMQGCAYNAKQSQLVTYIPQALGAGAKLFADTQADAVMIEGGRATGVACSFVDRRTGQPSGHRLTVKAKVVIVAAGGYNSAALLMRSRVPDPSRQLGRNLRLNPCPMLFGLFDHDVVMWRNIPAATGVMDLRLARYDRRGRYLEGGYLLHPNQLTPAVLAAVLPGLGRAHRRLMDRAHQIGSAIAWIDDVNSGHVTLDQEKNPVWHYEISGVDVLQVRDALRKQARVLLAAGATEVLVPDAVGTRIRDMGRVDAVIDRVEIGGGSMMFAAPHPAGACRMGEDPSRSVVNSWNEVHSVRNLFVCDPSVFPTAVSVDPSETIMAWSFRAAHHLRDEWQHYAGRAT